MVNHVRTLLLNADGRSTDSADGEEYVPPDYRPPDLAGPLGNVRAILFGHAPDRLALNVRLRQYLAIIHGSELAPFATAPDPRVTYLPAEAGPPFGFGVTVAPAGSAPPLGLIGGLPSEAGSGRCRATWSVLLVPA